VTKRNVSEGAEELLDVYYPVLDYGFVALVDYMGNDQSVERSARVSYGNGTRAVSDTTNLIRYLMRHDHSTPFESVELVFHMAMPIFVARQIVRHRTASLNEASARYSLMSEVMYWPEKFRLQSANNKQGSSREALVNEDIQEAQQALGTSYDEARWGYNLLNDMGVARELSRIVMPVGAYTEWYWKVDLRNLLHFLNLRTHPHAQLEVREYADVMAAMLQHAYPIIYQAWRDYQGDAIKFTRLELDVLSSLSAEGNPSELKLTLLTEMGNLSARERGEFQSKLEQMKSQSRPGFALPLQTMTPDEARARYLGKVS